MGRTGTRDAGPGGPSLSPTLTTPTPIPTLAPDGDQPDSPSPAGILRRAWSAPLWAHAALMAVVLLAVVPFVDPGTSFSADEGAAIVQAQALAGDDGWVVDHPVPEVDAEGRYYPLELSARGPKGTAPFAKHPLYAIVLSGADRLGGVTAMVLLSVLGTTVAALLAGALARRMLPSLARPALWAVGLGSPLLFDGYLVIAHTLGAALVTGAVLFALRALEEPSVRRVAGSCAGLLACLAAAILLRTEATLFALALAATCGAFAVLRRSLPALMLAGCSVLVAGATRLAEGRWVRHIVGGTPVTTGASGRGSSGLAGRWNGFRLTWLTPSYNGPSTHDMALVAVIVLVVAVAVVVRRRPHDGTGVILFSGLAAIAALAALAAGPDVLTPGLVMTLPLALAGVLVLRRRALSSVAGILAGGSFALFAAAVLATQYPQGGSGEWGGRYFALGLPLLVPIALAGLAGQRDRVQRTAGRVAIGALVVCTAAISVKAVSSLRSYHRATANLLAMVDRGGAEVVGGMAGERPVLVTTWGAVPRMAWDSFDRQRWLLVDPDDPTALPDLVGRLRAAGVDRFGLVTRHVERDTALLGPETHVADRQGGPETDWRVLVVDVLPEP